MEDYTITLNNGYKFLVTRYGWACFCEAYYRNKYKDPHSEFAKLIDVSKQEAKEICYRMMYTNEVIVKMLNIQAEME